MERVLVTGGAGFIGSNIANMLADDYNVTVLDNGYLGDKQNIDDRVKFVNRSVNEKKLPTDVDILFHLAALSSYYMHENAPVEGAQVNLGGFVNVAEQCIENGCDNIVYSSTSSIAPTPGDHSINTAYEASLKCREVYAEYMSNFYDITITGLRPHSVYEGLGGREHHKGRYANMISQFADQIANGETPVIYGDGTQKRDFIHVEDVSRAFIEAAESEVGGVWDVGTGSNTSFNEVISMICKSLETSISCEYIENPIGEDSYVHETLCDENSLEEATDWSPEITVEEGIDRVCSHYTG